MRRVLIFLLLFGGGLALLYYFSEEKKEQTKARLDSEQEQIVKEGRENDTPFIAIPDAPVTVQETPDAGVKTDDGSAISGFTARGGLKGVLREENVRKSKIYEFDFDNTEPRGDGFYDITGITVTLYEPETEAKRTTLKAESGVAKIEFKNSKPTVGQSELVRLTNAQITLHKGSPMAPIDLFLPKVDADLSNNSFYSDAEVRVEGEGLFATGLGLIVEQMKQRLVLERNGYMRFVGQGTDELELFAAPEGTIEFKRTEINAGLEKVEARLPKGGRLISKGERDLVVEGEAITLNGQVVLLDVPPPAQEEESAEIPGAKPKKRRVFHAEYARIVRNAAFSQGEDRVTGGVAEIRFDGAGKVKRMQMSENPVATGVLELDRSGTGEAAEPVKVRVSGRGPMTLEYSQSSPVAEFNLPGPATIEAPEAKFTLNAKEAMSGNFWGRGLAHVVLSGEVDGRLRDIAFHGSEVELRGSQSEQEEQRLFFETKQPAHLQGYDSKGNPVDLRSEQILQLKLAEGKPFIVLGREVALELIDEGLWTVNVGELRNFNLENATFTAGEGVRYGGPFGSGTALRAVGHSREHLEFFGDSENPATYDLDPKTSRDLELGLLRAQHIDIDSRRIRAETRVELRFRGGDYDEEIDCAWFELRPIGETVKGEPTLFEFEAREITRAVLRSPDGETTILANRVLGRGSYLEKQEGPKEQESVESATSQSGIKLGEFTATGKVEAVYTGKLGSFRATGDRILWKASGGTRLEAPEGERVEARGRFQEDGLPYVLTATWIEYSAGEIQALFPEITLDRPAALPQLLDGRSSTELHSGQAEWMTADESGLLLSGKAHFSGLTSEGEKLDLNAGSMHLQRTAGGDKRSQGVQELVAWDGFVLDVGDDLVGTGEVLQVGYQVLRMEGRPARFDVQGFAWESDNIEYDVPNVLITTDQGRILGAPGSPWEQWSATYESLQPFDNEDSTMMVMRNPIVRNKDREIRAEWATFWLDRQEWLKKTQEWLANEGSSEPEIPFGPDSEEDEPAVRAPTIFGSFDTKNISKVLKEMYFEGEIEYLRAGKRIALMDAAYVDLVDGHGWIQNAELSVPTKIGRSRTDLIIRADWLRHSADGSLSADYAEVTGCEFAEPHYFVRTKNLRLSPLDNESSVWDVLLKDNALIFDYGLKVPLPRVHYKSDEKGRPTFSGLRFGNTARYGTFVEASLDVKTDKSLNERVAPWIGVEPEEIDGSYRIKASYANARGLLLDQRFGLTAGDKFWMNVYLDGLYDSGEDRGMVRYKGEGNDGFRWVFNTQSRYLLTDKEWVDIVYSTQSDPGVQAEFTEGQFVSYERRDTFVRWRKAEDQNYYHAGVSYRADSFRNYVERMPDIGMMRSLTPIGDLWGQPLLYSATVDAAYLRKRDGTSSVMSPFDPLFDDGLGNRETLRADTVQRFETPFELGVGGIRVAPFASLQGTAWSEGEDPDQSPTRGAAIAGVEAQSTFFRTWNHGVINSITPFAGYRGDLASFEEDGEPMALDYVDDPITGRFLDLGVRSRWRVPGGRRYLDIAARGTHADAVAPGEEDGWQPLRVLGELLAMVKDIPFAIAHDALYDLDDGDTVLSYSSLSLLPHPQLGVELAYNRGLDDNRQLLYDAVTLGARWDATPKWQVEGRQSLSQIDNTKLASEFVLRRIGHDFVFEFSFGYRAGDGGNSFAFRYRPLLGWKVPNFGSMQTLQSTRL